MSIKSLEQCVKRRERYFQKIQFCFDLIKELPEKNESFISRYTNLQDVYRDFENVCEEMDNLNLELTDPKDKVDTSAAFKQFDIMYFECVTAYNRIVAEKSLQTTNSVESSSSSLPKPKLPQINISKFGGQLEQFSAFKSLYDNLIHNTTLAPIEKFSYLKSLLEGPALSIVEAITFDPVNYNLAYDTLVERYTNPRILASFYLNKILDQQPVKSPSLSNLRQIVDVFHINVQALKSLNITDLSGFMLLQLALRLLDNNTRKAFELEVKSKQFPTLDDLIDFLRAQCTVYELTKDTQKPSAVLTKPSCSFPRKALLSSQHSAPPTVTASSPSGPVTTAQINNSSPYRSAARCPMCKNSHQLYRCDQFLALAPLERYNTVRSFKRCFSCLGTHLVTACSSTSCCRFCKSTKHNSLLHDSSKMSTLSPSTSDAPQLSHNANSLPSMAVNANPSSNSTTAPVQTLSCQFHHNSTNNIALLGTAQVCIQDALGNWQTCRAVIDGGSQINFITNSLAQTLRLPIKKCHVDISGIGQQSDLIAKGSLTCNIASRYNSNDRLQFNAVIISKISSNLPTAPLSESLKQRFYSLNLADPEFHRPAKVDILLGAQAFTDILTDGLSLIKGCPTAMHTKFGWILLGDVPSELPSHEVNTLFVSAMNTDHLLEKFWEMEEIHLSKPLSPSDQLCESHYQATIARDETGRYVASLPFKNGSSPDLGSTREIALNKYLQQEKRLQRKQENLNHYTNHLQNYIEQGHMHLASEPSSYVLTHHGVLKESSSSSPLRVVFNASELSDTHQSLNKMLLTGPKLQTDIGTIISTFRLYPIALTCDIKQMYRAIRIAPSDCKYQHLFWRSNPTGPVQEWELERLTFGMASSPFIAQRTIKQLIMDEGPNYPRAAEVLSSSCYIDDIVCGAPSEHSALQLYNELNQLCSSGGFELHKWSTSSSSLLREIPTNRRETPHPLGSTHSIKVLGLEWDPATDCFHYSITPVNSTPTKRNVLSQIARVYDVNGFISPVIFSLKHLLQCIWLEKLDWDDPLPENIKHVWNRFVEELPLMSQLTIPRYILSNYISTQLIGFSDASKIGMCSVLYIRVECPNRQIECNLIQSKTKVAPLKPLTIPRLELSAALLLSQMVNSNQQIIEKLQISDIFLFTDSMNVLSWIRTAPHLLETFVANRVCKIIENTPVPLWHHISGDQNPADCGTRGLMPSTLIDHPLWWHGPPFILDDISSWPQTPENLPSAPTELKKPPPRQTLATNIQPQNDLYEWMNRFSTLTKLQNSMSYVLRFIHNTRSSQLNKSFGPLSVKERTEALNQCVNIVQRQHYSQDIKLISQEKPCSPTLRKLSPFLSSDTLKVGGRLKHAPLPDSSKHPLLIPQCHFANLLCDHYHLHSLHGGPKLVQSLLQRRYWIPGARNIIRKRIFRCLTCYKMKAKPIQPLMADLPPSRFEQSRCFVNVGLDFAGPFLIKESTRRNARLSKCYIALFVCMTIKAVHLELVHSLTTESCLAAIDRFIARRGLCRNLYSDQGRNFVGAARQLQEVYSLLKDSSTQISDHLTKKEIHWNFNPPYSPNFGGLWEAAVKSTKHHLKRILHNHNFTAEEFSTFLCRIEAVLNSRPLCALPSSTDDDFNYLTPSHFLIGDLLLLRPEEDLTQEPLNLMSRWQQVSRASQHFWQSWKKDYLHSQIQRSKWTEKTTNLKEGDLVLMYSSNTDPLTWPLGRIVKVLPGPDNVVRVVQVKTPTGILTRPVNKLVVLPCV